MRFSAKVKRCAETLHQRTQQPQHGIQQRAREGGATVGQMHLAAGGQGAEDVVPEDGDLAIVEQQCPALEVEVEAAVVHVDAAHYGGAVVADVALGVEEAGAELVDAHPGPQQGQIVRPGEPVDQLLVRDAGQHQPDVHPRLAADLRASSMVSPTAK